jgi:hypothetical protein
VIQQVGGCCSAFYPESVESPTQSPRLFPGQLPEEYESKQGRGDIVSHMRDFPNQDYEKRLPAYKAVVYVPNLLPTQCLGHLKHLNA